jgi:hypothetical protein
MVEKRPNNRSKRAEILRRFGVEILSVLRVVNNARPTRFCRRKPLQN